MDISIPNNLQYPACIDYKTILPKREHFSYVPDIFTNSFPTFFASAYVSPLASAFINICLYYRSLFRISLSEMIIFLSL